MNAPARPPRAWIALVSTAAVLVVAYVFLISAGQMTHWPFYVGYLNDLADGFLKGHLHLGIEPPAALAASPHPFSAENRGLWYWDVSLYNKHYYLYWGPVPALMLAAGKGLFHVHAVVGDQVMVFVLASIQMVALAWIIGRAARSMFDDPPVSLQVLALVVAAFANPTPYNIGRPAVYEAAIVGGQAFLLLGVACAAESVARSGGRIGWRIGAGAAWALALGCRVSLAPAVALMLAATAWVESSGPRAIGARLRRFVLVALPAGIPLAIGLFALLLYNRLRFDAWLEFGRRYQLTWIAAPTSWHYLLPNVYSYLMRATVTSCRFPFAFAIPDMGAARAFPSWYKLPDGYFVYEQVAGLLAACPWSWLAPVALVAAVRKRRAAGGWTPAVWAIVVAAIGATVAVLPGMSLASSTNRYLGDAVGGGVLLGAFGLFVLHRAMRDRPSWRRAAMAAGLTLGALSVWIGLALGFLGQYGHFPSNNPALANQLVQKLSVCGGPPAPPPK